MVNVYRCSEDNRVKQEGKEICSWNGRKERRAECAMAGEDGREGKERRGKKEARKKRLVKT